MMFRRAVTCAGAALLLASCSQSTQPVQPSPATPASGNQVKQVLSSHKFDGQTAHVQFNTQVNGTIVATAFFADHIKDKSTVSGFNKFDDVIVGIFSRMPRTRPAS